MFAQGQDLLVGLPVAFDLIWTDKGRGCVTANINHFSVSFKVFVLHMDIFLQLYVLIHVGGWVGEEGEAREFAVTQQNESDSHLAAYLA